MTVAGAGDELSRADELFRARDDVQNLRAGAALLESMLSRGAPDYDVLWRLARFRYHLGDRQPVETEGIRLFHSGIEAAQQAVAQAPGRVEGHFWLGANQGQYADRKGALTGLGLVRRIRREFERAFEIDPGYENGAVYVALGELDLRLPGLLGGSDRRGLETFEKGLARAPDNVELRIRLAGHYLGKGRREEARSLLAAALTLEDPTRTPAESARLSSQAQEMLLDVSR